MQTIDRSKYKSTPLSELETTTQNTQTNNYQNERNYLQLNPGLNKFRLYPAHADGGGSKFAEPAEFFWIEIEADEYINNQKTGAKILKKKRVFDALTHSAYLKKDPIREYIKYAEKVIKDTIVDEKEKTDKLGLLAHYQYGLKSQKVYYVYAQRIVNGKLGEFGLLEIKPSLMNRLNQIASVEGVEDVLGIEPYTDVNDGFPIAITYNKGGDPRLTYSLELDKSFDRATKQLITYPFSDQDLMLFESKESLFSLYRNVYKRRDFELAVEGIERFDKKNGLGVCDYEEFNEIILDIYKSIVDDVKEDVKKPTINNGDSPTYLGGSNVPGLSNSNFGTVTQATPSANVSYGTPVTKATKVSPQTTSDYTNNHKIMQQVAQETTTAQPTTQSTVNSTVPMYMSEKIAALKAKMDKF